MELKFECTQCGKCCHQPSGHTVLSPVDVRRLATSLRSDVKKFIDSYCYLLRTRIVEGSKEIFETCDLCLRKSNTGCVFIDEKLCGVQDVKPLTCRAFPFLGNVDYVKLCMEEQNYCEGFGRGKSFSERQVELELSKNRRAFLDDNEELIINNMDIRKIFDVSSSNCVEEVISDDKLVLF